MKAPMTMAEARKNDKGKLMFDLIDPKFEEEIAAVLTFGARKYAPNNWQHLKDGTDRHYAALCRHLNKWRQGENIDPESKLPHLWHAATNIMFIMHHERPENKIAQQEYEHPYGFDEEND